MDIDVGLDLSLPSSHIKPAILSALLTSGALCGLFAYLNRYTRKHYFTIWTAAWLFYALWVLLHLVWPFQTAEDGILISRQCSLGLAGVFLLWGSAEFLEQKAPQRVMALFLTFVLVWSSAGILYDGEPQDWQWPIFALLGLSSIMTSASFFRFRRRYHYVGAGLLSFGFLFWGIFFLFLRRLLNDDLAITACFVVMDLLQLFLAVSMIVLVLEEVRTDVLAVERTIEAKKSETTILHARVRSSEERYHTLFEQANDPIIVAGEKLKIHEFNASARHLLGVEDNPGSALRLSSFLRLHGKGPPEESLAGWMEFFNSRKLVELVRKDGTSVSVEVQAAPIQLHQRAAIQIVLREVTERVRLEQQLRQAEKLSALGQMISGVAHELNNPLAAVRGYTELMLTSHDLPAKTRANLELVSKESSRAGKLVSQFLAFARAESPRCAAVNLNNIARESAALREFEFKVAAVELALELDLDLPETMADADKAAQAVLNLLGNALHALCDRPQPRVVRVSTRVLGDEIQVAVADNGPGIPEELLPRIFEPFFTTKQVGAGTGLGLSVVHGIMTDHGGRAFHQENPGGGATFVLAFPLVEISQDAVHSAAPAQVMKSEMASLENVRVLVLDDEPSIASMLKEMLDLLGCDADMATAGSRALELVQTKEFDLVLSDFKMPNMDGQQFYEAVLKVKPALAARIIFLSGDVISDRTQQFLASIPNHYLCKPFNLTEVQSVMSKVLSQADADSSSDDKR